MIGTNEALRQPLQALRQWPTLPQPGLRHFRERSLLAPHAGIASCSFLSYPDDREAPAPPHLACVRHLLRLPGGGNARTEPSSSMSISGHSHANVLRRIYSLLGTAVTRMSRFIQTVPGWPRRCRPSLRSPCATHQSHQLLSEVLNAVTAAQVVRVCAVASVK
jgi:hypothetical protein